MGGGDKVPGKYMGWWGALGSQPQKGIVTYGLSANRQRPMAGAYHAAVFNIWRRFRTQFFYWATPFAAYYFLLQWSIKRNKYLNSKAGRIEMGEYE